MIDYKRGGVGSLPPLCMRPPTHPHPSSHTHPVDDVHAAVLEEAVVDPVQTVHVRVPRVLDGLPVEPERLGDGLRRLLSPARGKRTWGGVDE